MGISTAKRQRGKRGSLISPIKLTGGACLASEADISDLDKVPVCFEVKLGRVGVEGFDSADDALLIAAVIARAIGDACAIVDHLAVLAPSHDFPELSVGHWRKRRPLRRRWWRRLRGRLRRGRGENPRTAVNAYGGVRGM